MGIGQSGAAAPLQEQVERDGEVIPFQRDAVEVSVVIPCLDEAETIEACIEQALSVIRSLEIDGEVVVADNGSTDGSPEIARRSGAVVVQVLEKGYGSALMGGIRAARGEYILMGDADGSYDFRELPRFLEKLREGHALVQGCRLPSGGGEVLPGAMPFLHRWFGNPFFSFLARLIFRAPIQDVNCGLRGFSKEFFQKIDQRCTGMEFAVEMVLKAALFGEKIGEVPITLSPDKRLSRKPHLKTFRDGWRTLRFYMVCSPRWLFLYPGALLMLLSSVVFLCGVLQLQLGGIGLGPNTALAAMPGVVIGYQLIIFAVSAKIFGIMEGLLPPDRKLERALQLFSLERGLLTGLLGLGVGLALMFSALWRWSASGWGELPIADTLHFTAPGVLLLIVGCQTIFSSFFLSILGMSRRV